MPRKSDADHFLQGTKSQAKPSGVDETVPAGRPRIPKNISTEAQQVFKRLCKLLAARRALTEGDCEILRLYAVQYDRHAKALGKIAAEGEIRMYTRLDSNGQPHEQEKANLWLKVAETCERNMVACLDRLGLSPINRAKVKPTGGPVKKEPTPGTAAALMPELFEGNDYEQSDNEDALAI